GSVSKSGGSGPGRVGDETSIRSHGRTCRIRKSNRVDDGVGAHQISHAGLQIVTQDKRRAVGGFERDVLSVRADSWIFGGKGMVPRIDQRQDRGNVSADPDRSA